MIDASVADLQAGAGIVYLCMRVKHDSGQFHVPHLQGSAS